MISKSQQNMAVLDDEIKFTNNMKETPKSLRLDKINCDNSLSQSPKEEENKNLVEYINESQIKSKKIEENVEVKSDEFPSDTRIHLSFSVDRLLNDKIQQNQKSSNPAINSDIHVHDQRSDKCCDGLTSAYACCSLRNCLISSTLSCKRSSYQTNDEEMTTTPAVTFMDFKSIVRPTPVRAMGNGSEAVSHLAHFSALAPASLIRFHHAHMQQQKQLTQHLPAQPNFALSSLINPLCGLKPLQITTPQMVVQNFSSAPVNRFNTKANVDISVVRPSLACIPALRHHHLPTSNANEAHGSFSNNATSTAPVNATTANINSGNSHGNNVGGGKRKRSWSRAVFSNLQRKGLEIQFQQQKYITKPDRRKLAARLNLTDAQVKVWFQNRRMKWRHTRENLKSGQEKQPVETASTDALKANIDNGNDMPSYSSDGSSSIGMSDVEDDDDDGEIDVVE